MMPYWFCIFSKNKTESKKNPSWNVNGMKAGTLSFLLTSIPNTKDITLHTAITY